MPRRGGLFSTLVERSRAGAQTEADDVADGVRETSRQIATQVRPGFLYFAGPLQYVVERIAPAACREHAIEVERVEDVAAYLLAALQEFAVALVGEFDREHFEAWIAAQENQE